MSRFELPDRRLRLAFFGTPDIARTILDGILTADADDVVLVVCQPDKPKGRGKKVQFPPVKEAALEAKIEVVQPKKLKDGVLAARLHELKIDLSIVVAYGRILPRDLFEAPANDTINVHASLLPRHRGASPIQHAILAGDPEAGVTLMMLSKAMDEGDMFFKQAIALDGTETGGSLFEAMAELGRDALLEGLRQAKAGGLPRIEQVHAEATYAPRLEKKQGQLNLHEPATVLQRKIRAFNPWPGTYVPWVDGNLKIHEAEVVASEQTAAPGTILSLEPLVIQTAEQALLLRRVQPPGKRAMTASDFMRGAGRKLKVGESLPTIEA